MKNTVFDVNLTQIMLQLHDKQVLSDKELEEKLHMNFKTGEMDETYWAGADEILKIQLCQQLFDRNHLSKKVLLGIIFE